MTQLDASRRLFLQRAGAMTALAGVGTPLALNLAAISSAAAQTANDYKAIVCIFLFGGNDSFNMVVPTDTDSFANYTKVRNQAPESIALLAPGIPRGGNGTLPTQLGGVLPLSPVSPLNHPGRSFALHPTMGSLQSMFNTDRRLAVLPNIGPLIRPTNKAQYAQASFPKPKSLGSHNDQQNTWQSLLPEGSTRGWGGRMGDLLASMNSKAVFTSISVAGRAVWLAGEQVQQYQVSSNGAVRMGTDGSGRVYGSAAVGAAMDRIVRASRNGHMLGNDIATVSARSIDAEVLLRSALAARPASDARFGTPPTGTSTYNTNNDPKLRYTNPANGNTEFNSLAQQMQMVARMIDASRNTDIGARRQVFFVSMGGFDTHGQQNANHAQLMARLAHAMTYFDTTLAAIGASNNVTTFTASDFGRTFTSNGDGTDHGWGSHHFVMGGAVKGGDLYGAFPVYGSKNANNNNFDSSPDQVGNGSLLPTTSVDQLGATLGKWFGLSDGQLLDVFPNLNQWDVAQRNLGFMV